MYQLLSCSTVFQLHHATCRGCIPFYSGKITWVKDIVHFAYLFISCWTFGLCSVWDQNEKQCCGRSWTHFHVGRCFLFLVVHTWGCAIAGWCGDSACNLARTCPQVCSVAAPAVHAGSAFSTSSAALATQSSFFNITPLWEGSGFTDYLNHFHILFL